VEAGGVEGGAESGRWKNLILVICDILVQHKCICNAFLKSDRCIHLF